MSLNYGGCLCGAIRYATSADPVRVTYCHCKFCQRATGSAYMVEPIFARDFAERGLDTGETFDQRASCRHQPVALFGQRQRMGGAMQKPHSASLFEAGNRLGHRRGGRPRPPRGFGEGARLDDANEGEETRDVGRQIRCGHIVHIIMAIRSLQEPLPRS